MKRTAASFSVDTHIFRELGELLVGRNSTALMELVKNSYDADSKTVTLFGEHLADARNGRLIVQDDGNGMTPEVFEQGFLRVATRLKDTAARFSPRYERRFTGAKGIGRLSAHKLARQMHIVSVPSPEVYGDGALAIDAMILWDEVEKSPTLDKLGPNAVRLRTFSPAPDRSPGTTIALMGIRHPWTPTERSELYTEVESFQPPSQILSLPKGLTSTLFDTPVYRQSRGTDPGFGIELEGELLAGEHYWQNLANTAFWVLEIDALSRPTIVKTNMTPTRRLLRKNRRAECHSYSNPHPAPEGGPHFQARIYIREGQFKGTNAEKAWQGKNSGVRVYLEGFRVLPYGQRADDWLNLDQDYKARSRNLELLEGSGLGDAIALQGEGLSFLSNQGYFGAVFLTLDRSPGLQMLVNREGFIPGPQLDAIVKIVRTSLALSVRVRVATRAKEERPDSSGLPVHSNSNPKMEKRATQPRVTERANHVRTLTAKAERLVSKGQTKAAAEILFEASSLALDTLDMVIDEAALFRILASVGTQMAGFVHEINGLLGSMNSLELAAEQLLSQSASGKSGSPKLAELKRAIGDVRRAVERQASYLTDIISPDARRRRSKQKLRGRFETSRTLVEQVAAQRKIEINNRIAEDALSPPMFPAELTVVFTNLLTNAIKAAGQGGQIIATATQTEESLAIRIENTGQRVMPRDYERWFRPFESTTGETDPILGQGMGMGLSLTKQILREYGATISFTRPSKGFATAIEIEFARE